MTEDKRLSLVSGENKRKIRLEVDETIIHELELIAQKTGCTRDELINEAVKKLLSSTEN